MATDEDKKWQIDRWARLFKSSRWEELRMIAAQDTEMTDTAKTLYDKNQDEYAANVKQNLTLLGKHFLPCTVIRIQHCMVRSF
jgi:hypothetical protein